MHNWSVDEKYMKKFPEKYMLWRLEQMISYGLDGEKLDKKKVIIHWDYLKKRLDPQKRKYIEFLLWPKQS